MALRGYATLQKRNKVLAKCFGAVDFTPPGTYYFGIHFATSLTANATATSNIISCTNAPAPGAHIIIAPFFVGATDFSSEEHVVLSVSGGGPYTVTLVDTLLYNHLTGAYVAFDPGVNGANALEHTGDNYARQSLVNTAGNYTGPSGGISNVGLQLTWGTPSATWGLATHILGYDALTVGTLWDVFVLQSFILLDITTPAPPITVGNLIARALPPGT